MQWETERVTHLDDIGLGRGTYPLESWPLHLRMQEIDPIGLGTP